MSAQPAPRARHARWKGPRRDDAQPVAEVRCKRCRNDHHRQVVANFLRTDVGFVWSAATAPDAATALDWVPLAGFPYETELPGWCPKPGHGSRRVRYGQVVNRVTRARGKKVTIYA